MDPMPEAVEKYLEKAYHGDGISLVFAVWEAQPDGWFCISLRPLDPPKFHDIWFRKEGDVLTCEWSTVPEWAFARSVGDRVLKLFGDDWDTYWCPSAFSRPRRMKDNVLPSHWLFADLDFMPPHELLHPPTFSWETSPGKWQCVWWVQRYMEPSEYARVNKGIGHESGADRNTWNVNRLLRVPGSAHLKARRAAAA